jgi:hypothetical protein
MLVRYHVNIVNTVELEFRPGDWHHMRCESNDLYQLTTHPHSCSNTNFPF